MMMMVSFVGSDFQDKVITPMRFGEMWMNVSLVGYVTFLRLTNARSSSRKNNACRRSVALSCETHPG